MKVVTGGFHHHFTGPLEYRNRLRVTGSGHTFDQWTVEGAINISGSAPNSQGLLYAPNGGADFSGSDYVMGSIVAPKIDISGADFHIEAYPYWGRVTYQVRLIL